MKYFATASFLIAFGAIVLTGVTWNLSPQGDVAKALARDELVVRAVYPQAIPVALALAAASFFVAGKLRYATSPNLESWGYLLLGAWALGPPLYFWIEWTYFTSHLCEKDREVIQYSQQLAKELWIAFVIVLAVILGVEWPPKLPQVKKHEP